jgi:hypothetical protein
LQAAQDVNVGGRASRTQFQYTLTAWALRATAIDIRRPTLPAYLAGFMSVSDSGVGLFPYPHPLHTVFGLSELISYQAPIALALAWRGAAWMGGIAAFSGVVALLPPMDRYSCQRPSCRSH